MREQVNETNRVAVLLDKHALSILLGSVFISLIMVSQLIPFPEFSTEVSDFAPPDESERQIEAILFSASEPVEVETIEDRIQTNINVLKILQKKILFTEF